MQAIKTRLALVAVLAAFGAAAHAALPAGDNLDRQSETRFMSTKSRDQVKAELNDAIRSGDIVTGGESPRKLNELQPQWYPTQPKAAGKTREQVRAEGIQAAAAAAHRVEAIN